MIVQFLETPVTAFGHVLYKLIILASYNFSVGKYRLQHNLNCFGYFVLSNIDIEEIIYIILAIWIHPYRTYVVDQDVKSKISLR